MTSLVEAGLALLASGSAGAADPPRRVLSLNLCTDQFVLSLAERSDVAGVSRLARDCRLSAVCAVAREVPAVRGSAEEVIATQPDLVLAGETGAASAVAAARRLRIPVVVLSPATSLEMIRDHILAIGAALGRPERGQALAASFEQRLAQLPPPAPGPRLVASVYEPNGFVAGAGSLADAVLARAGLDDFARREHLDRYGSVPLEYLVAHPPDLLVTEEQPASPSLAESMLWHPALQDAFTGRRVTVPGRDWICGSPATADAVERLVDARLARQR
ncbi:MAG: ABC transporter substrate-binding protein [Acetobacteraceae bacterium]|nr:ABC transporter substrate-binding protein [Acetobacteraceae bacterium]